MFGERSIQLVRIAGIRIGASPSWFLVLFFVIWSLSGSFQETLRSTETEAYLVAIIAAVLFFGSIVLHELGHAFEARRSGMKVEGIDLWFFGGLAKLNRDSESPGEEFRVAAAGPAVTLLLFLLAAAISVALYGADEVMDVVRLRDAVADPVELLVSWFALMNAVLFVFNLLPAFPLDGGRIARSIIWKITGDRTKGTIAAARLGQGFGFLLIAYGAYELLVPEDAGWGGVWWVVLGWLIAGSAKSAAVSARVTDRLEGVTVGMIMDEHPVTMPASTRLIDAEDWFERHGADWFAVVDDEGRLLGIAERERIADAINHGQPALSASEILTPGEPVGTDQPLEAVIGAEPLRRLGAVMAVDQAGILRGVLTVEQVRRALTTALP